MRQQQLLLAATIVGHWDKRMENFTFTSSSSSQQKAATTWTNFATVAATAKAATVACGSGILNGLATCNKARTIPKTRTRTTTRTTLKARPSQEQDSDID